MKTCKKCGIKKPNSEFYKAAKNKDGLFTKCKHCVTKEIEHLQMVIDTHYKNWWRDCIAPQATNTPLQLRVCEKCNIEKTIDHFYSDKRPSMEQRTVCNSCEMGLKRSDTKKCKTCKKIKPVKEFHKDKNNSTGYQDACSDCSTDKFCKGCLKIKPREEFTKDKRNKDGLRTICKDCTNFAKRSARRVPISAKPYEGATYAL